MHTCSGCKVLTVREGDDEYRTCQSKLEKCTICEELQRMNIEVANARALVDSLLEQRRQAKANINNNHPSMLERMPLEVITLIFETYIKSIRNGVPEGQLKTHSPFILGAVCQNWRRIAWSTPSLWSSFHLVLPWYQGRRRQITIELAVEWLERSSPLPLTILFHHQPTPRIKFDDLYPLMNAISRHAARWKTVDLRLPSRSLSFLAKACGPSPFLHTLKISCMDVYTPTGVNIGLVDMAPVILKLKTIRYAAVKVELTKIEEFSADLCSLNQLLRVFQGSPRMVKCNVKIGDQSSEPNNGSEVVHSQLESLAIGFSGSRSPPEFFNYVTFPSLRYLQLKLYRVAPVNLRDIFSRQLPFFIKRSACDLQELDIQDASISGEDLVCLAKFLPSLICLKVASKLVSDLPPLDAFYQSLDSSSQALGGEMILPKLKEFHMTDVLPPTWDLLAGGLWERPLKVLILQIKIGSEALNNLTYIDTDTLRRLESFGKAATVSIGIYGLYDRIEDWLECSRLNALTNA